MMKAFLILIFIFGFAHAEEGIAKVVYDLTTGKIEKLEKTLLKGIVAHKNHYEGNMKELEVAVVIHGDAYKFFLKDIQNSPYNKESHLVSGYADLKKRIASMSQNYGVEFFICKSGMRKNKLEDKDIVDFVKIIPNSTIGLIDKQNEGFAYIPLGD